METASERPWTSYTLYSAEAAASFCAELAKRGIALHFEPMLGDSYTVAVRTASAPLAASLYQMSNPEQGYPFPEVYIRPMTSLGGNISYVVFNRRVPELRESVSRVSTRELAERAAQAAKQRDDLVAVHIGEGNWRWNRWEVRTVHEGAWYSVFSTKAEADACAQREEARNQEDC